MKKVKKVVKLVGFVNSESTFIDQPKVSIIYFSLSFSLPLMTLFPFFSLTPLQHTHAFAHLLSPLVFPMSHPL